MNFTDAIKTCFRKYATFSGRASRPEYWWFVLFVVLCEVALGILDEFIWGGNVARSEIGQDSINVTVESNGYFAGIFGLATLIPWLAVGWRRMHDTGRSGLYLLYPLIVWVGIVTAAAFYANFNDEMSTAFGIIIAAAVIIAILSPLIVIWWLTRPTQPEPNLYGPPPQSNPHEVPE